MTVIWAILNRFVSSILDLGLEIGREFFEQISDGRFLFSRPLWSRRDETTSKNLGRLFGRCRVTDGRLPTLKSDQMSSNTLKPPKQLSWNTSHLLNQESIPHTISGPHQIIKQ